MSTLTNMRKRYLSDPAFKMFKKVLPPLSDTEREAMEAGSVWWDGGAIQRFSQLEYLAELPETIAD